MIQTTLAFERQRRSGQVPQVALVILLANTTLVVTGSGIPGLDGGVLTPLDGSRTLDGSWQLGADIQTVERGLLSAGDLTEGDAAGGSVSAPALTVLPSAKTTWRAELDNVGARISALQVNEPWIGKRAEMRLTYPGLSLTDMVTRFSGEIATLTLSRERCALDLRSA